MPTVNIDGKPYELDQLSDEAKIQLQMLSASEAKIRALQTELAMVQTARNTYARALAEALPKSA